LLKPFSEIRKRLQQQQGYEEDNQSNNDTSTSGSSQKSECQKYAHPDNEKFD